MVVEQAKRTKKIRTRNDDLAARFRDAHQLGDKRLRRLDMLEDVQRADAVEDRVAERQRPSVVKLAAVAHALGLFDVRPGHLDPVRLVPGIHQALHHLAHAAADVKCLAARLVRAKRVGVLRIKTGIPAFEKVSVFLVFAVVTLLLTHYAEDFFRSSTMTKPSRPKPPSSEAKLT